MSVEGGGGGGGACVGMSVERGVGGSCVCVSVRREGIEAINARRITMTSEYVQMFRIFLDSFLQLSLKVLVVR